LSLKGSSGSGSAEEGANKISKRLNLEEEIKKGGLDSDL
jgi:hypothetical protein